MKDNKKNKKFNESQDNREDENLEAQSVSPEENVEVDDVSPEDAEVLGVEEADEVERLKEELAKEKKEYLFLMAEFDNFRKRTLKEKSELIKNASENVFKGLLPIVDDFERGLKATENTEDAASMREGMELIYNKLVKFMEQNGVKAIYPEDKNFDTEYHEAISAVPVPDEEQKGKILDTVEKGYTINGKVLRHAKVVVGQ